MGKIKSLALMTYKYFKLDVVLWCTTCLVLVGSLLMAFIFKRDYFQLQAFRTFDLKDTSIGYQHSPSKIPGNWNILITTIYVIAASLTSSLLTRVGRRGINPTSKLAYLPGDERVKLRMYRVVWGLLWCFLALAATNLLTNLSKTLMGVLKPFFLSECDPDMKYLPAGETWVNETVTQVICRNTKDFDYRRSFPSGHISQASVSVIYGVLELHSLSNGVLALALQLIGVAYSLVMSCYRITGHHHNWYDVLAGYIYGTVIAAFCYYMKQLQLKRQTTPLEVPSPTHQQMSDIRAYQDRL